MKLYKFIEIGQINVNMNEGHPTLANRRRRNRPKKRNRAKNQMQAEAEDEEEEEHIEKAKHVVSNDERQTKQQNKSQSSGQPKVTVDAKGFTSILLGPGGQTSQETRNVLSSTPTSTASAGTEALKQSDNQQKPAKYRHTVAGGMSRDTYSKKIKDERSSANGSQSKSTSSSESSLSMRVNPNPPIISSITYENSSNTSKPAPHNRVHHSSESKLETEKRGIESVELTQEIKATKNQVQEAQNNQINKAEINPLENESSKIHKDDQLLKSEQELEKNFIFKVVSFTIFILSLRLFYFL